MKKINIIFAIFCLGGYFSNAQVDDISLTISPAADYTKWDDKAGLEDGFLIGGKLGFGFGEYMELRAIYMQSLDLKTNFDNFGMPNYNPDLFTARDVKLTRWGGEFKANIGTKRLNPYITVGTGVQKLELESSNDLEQIYGSFGLGVKLNLSPRAVFNLEAKNTTYNFNAGSNLLSDADKALFAVTDADFARERLYNWSIQGSLQFYLGGRKPGNLTALDRAYLNKFNGGLKGLQLIIEPSMAYIGFNDKSLFRDSYFLGGYAGVDFNEYIGIRGFYFQATENEEISTKFDELAMYGMELRARLNDGNGVTPYLMLGGGYLNSYADYRGKEGAIVESGEFATGGLGLNIPLGKRLLISGGVRAMLTAGGDIEDVNVTDDLQTHLMYNVGLKLSLGKKSVAPQTIYEDNLNQELALQQESNNAKIENLKSSYQDKVAALEQELQDAYAEKDVEKAVTILENKKQAEDALEEVEKLETVNKLQPKEIVAVKEEVKVVAPVVTPVVPQTEMIKMTPAEFESLIERILNDLDTQPASLKSMEQQLMQPKNNSNQIEVLQKRIDRLEKLLIETNASKGAVNSTDMQQMQMDHQNARISDMSNQILDKLNDLNRKIDRNSESINAVNQAPQALIINTDGSSATDYTAEPTTEESNSFEEEVINEDAVEEIVAVEPVMNYLYTSAMLGFNYGGASTANLGIRLHFDINNTSLQFMPEAYVGFGEGTSYGVSGNIVYPMKTISEKVTPYIGGGFGFGSVADQTKAFYNVILGTELPFLNKNLYVDYTMRNSFDNNQIALGYKLTF